MAWYWLWLIVGVATPWVVMPTVILGAFQERGPLTGLGWWLGMCVVTVPLMLGIGWLASTMLG